jgi:hypothetical protein
MIDGTDNTEETVKEKTKSYMAGLFDAEGCARLATHKRGDKTYFEPKVFVSNKSRALMQWLVLHFGGNFARNVNCNAGEDWYNWYLQSFSSVASFLKTILPYLKYKREQAEVLIEFIENRDNLSEVQKFEYLNKLKELKHHGSVTTETNSSFLKSEPAYLAGFFDGEGCIRVNKTPTEHSPSYHLIVTIANNDRSILDSCLKLYGGDVRKKDKRDCYSWSLFNKVHIKQFLLDALPYLVVKRDEALSGMDYIDLGHKKHCPEKREEIYQKLVLLKKLKIQSELHGDMQSVPTETLDTKTQ